VAHNNAAKVVNKDKELVVRFRFIFMICFALFQFLFRISLLVVETAVVFWWPSNIGACVRKSISGAFNRPKQPLIRRRILYDQLSLPVNGQHCWPAAPLQPLQNRLGIAVKICKGLDVLDSDLGFFHFMIHTRSFAVRHE
jgi:hypothetical protein